MFKFSAKSFSLFLSIVIGLLTLVLTILNSLSINYGQLDVLFLLILIFSLLSLPLNLFLLSKFFRKKDFSALLIAVLGFLVVIPIFYGFWQVYQFTSQFRE